MSLGKTKTRGVQVSANVHSALTDFAALRSAEVGKRVTLRELIEEALIKTFPQLAQMGGVTTEAEDAAPQTFRAVMAAAFSSSPIDIGGAVVGSFGQPVTLADLAQYLKDRMPPVQTLKELVQSYEQQQGQASQVQS